MAAQPPLSVYSGLTAGSHARIFSAAYTQNETVSLPFDVVDDYFVVVSGP